jgi:protein-L-isoaspartate O-methyltransferase
MCAVIAVMYSLLCVVLVIGALPPRVSGVRFLTVVCGVGYGSAFMARVLLSL